MILWQRSNPPARFTPGVTVRLLTDTAGDALKGCTAVVTKVENNLVWAQLDYHDAVRRVPELKEYGVGAMGFHAEDLETL